MCLPALGDHIRDALAQVGVNEHRVAEWLGRPCGCDERRLRLNALGAWADRVLRGKMAAAQLYLESFLGED